MRSAIGALGALTLLTLLGILVYVLFTQDRFTATEQSAETHAVAPGFSLPNAEGELIALEKINAEVRIINFWASWSPYSKDELSALVHIKETYGKKIAIIALNRDTNPVDGRAFLASLGLEDELLFAYDREDTYFKKVGGYAMPETLFLDREGNILAHIHGPMKEVDMRATLDEILSK